MKKTTYFILLQILGIPFYITASVYYVSPSGDDNNSGTQSQPWKTISKAMSSLMSGDTCYVLPGTYDLGGQVVQPAYAGSVNNQIALMAMSTAWQIIGQGNQPNAQDPNNQAYIENGAIAITQDYWTIDGFYFRNNGFISGNNATGVRISNILNYVEPHISGMPYGNYSILFMYMQDFEIDHCEFWTVMLDRAQAPETVVNGLAVVESDQFTIKNIMLYGFRNGLKLTGTNAMIEDNQILYCQEHFCGMNRLENFHFTRNIWYGVSDGYWGQQTHWFGADVNTYARNGVIENNIIIFARGIEFRGVDNSHSNILIRNNFVRPATSAPAAFYIWDANVPLNVFDSDYNACYSPYQGKNNMWSVAGIKYTQQQSCAQLQKDCHSIAFITDPGFVTPAAQLGQIDGISDPCTSWGGSGVSNCLSPHRIKITDDLHLTAGSPLVDAGDPAYGTNYPGNRIDIGVFEYGVSVVDDQSEEKYPTLACYPNPANQFTMIEFELDVPSVVTLDIMDHTGRPVLNLPDGKGVFSAGKHLCTLQTDNLSAGFYLLRLRTRQKTMIKRLIIVKN